MRIVQFPYGQDNLAYLICNGRQALAVDGGAVDAICRFLEQEDLQLVGITNTHGHGDHTVGNAELARRTAAPLLDHRQLARQGEVALAGGSVTVMATAGHTDDAVCFLAGGHLVSGDTLFNGTVGNCFSGDLEAFYRSIKALMALDPQTVVWGGHDYVELAMCEARRIEPANAAAIDAYMAAYDPRRVCSTLAQELAVNPYLRFNHPQLVQVLRSRSLPAATELERWKSVMSL